MSTHDNNDQIFSLEVKVAYQESPAGIVGKEHHLHQRSDLELGPSMRRPYPLSSKVGRERSADRGQHTHAQKPPPGWLHEHNDAKISPGLRWLILLSILASSWTGIRLGIRRGSRWDLNATQHRLLTLLADFPRRRLSLTEAG